VLKNILIIAVLLFMIDVALANPIPESSNFNVTSFNKVLHVEKDFKISSAAWSPNGRYLLITCSKSISLSNSIHRHYLFDTNSHAFGEIDYGIKELNSYSIPKAEWAPSGNRIYFRISRFAGSTDHGSCFIICNPDGKNLRGVGTNFTDLSNIINNVGSIGSQNNLKWNPNCSKVTFEWGEKSEEKIRGVYLANGDGTNAHEIQSKASQPIWYDSKKIIFVTDEGTVLLADYEGNIVQMFIPKNEERYAQFSLSPNRAKIMFTSIAKNGLSSYTYVSNIDGSNLKENFSCDEDFWANESWQPNGSLLLVNQDGNLYIINGEENNKRLLYKGNATKPQWFPDGKKILFVESKNKLYSIDIDGTNLSFITNFGLISSYFWELSEGAKQFSISPSGKIIAFTSALYPDTGKIIENEPNPSKYQNIAAPLFIVNSNGSNLTQVTPTVKGRYDTFGEWNPDGKQFTTNTIIFSKNSGLSGEGSSLVELSSENASSIWKNMPLKKIIGNEEFSNVDKIQINEPNSTNTSQVTEHKETSEKSPSSMFLQIFTCVVGIWLLHKKRDM
jgi:Tol biopolymer transport system component